MIQFGIDNLLQQNPVWKSERIALVTNHAATTCSYQPSRQALLTKGFNIIKLFSPEHGLDIKGADGAKMNNGIDALTQLPIISLYGNQLQPSANDLSDVDIVLFDIPDIGTRFYTYLWTMTHVLEACGKHNKRLIILDRPNPLSGNLSLIEGPMLNEEKCSSFIGRWSIPLRHSCTLGELALYFNKTKNINANIDVIKCIGWERNIFHSQWQLDFVPTSPAMQNFETALLYPGLGLLEATNISEGRGTDKPFIMIGAPWIDAEKLIGLLGNWLIGVKVKVVDFIPTVSKYEGQLCRGIEFTVEDVFTFNAVRNGLILIKTIKDLHPQQFAWKPYPTNVNPTGEQHLNKLLGVENSEALFELPFADFKIKMEELISDTSFAIAIKPYFLYQPFN